MTDEACCGNCNRWHLWTRTRPNDGQCKNNPGAVYERKGGRRLMPLVDIDCTHPHTSSFNWCDEHQPNTAQSTSGYERGA